MMRSLFSGVSGLKVHQTKMDVIGNNIANVNTIGFKSSAVNFSDVFYQTTQSASGPNAETGTAGTNAMQIGLGADLASITCNISATGSTQRTDRGLDLMINKDAFFVVDVAGTNYFTKSGSMNVDADGNLYCTSNGGLVMGWKADGDGNILKDTVSALNVMSADKLYSPPEATTDVTLSGNIDQKATTVQQNASGEIVAVNFYDKLGNSYTAKLKLVQGSSANPEIYNVTVTDVLDSNNKSILVKATTTAGATTYADAKQPLKLNGVDFTVATVNASTGAFTLSGNAAQLKFNASTGKFVSVGDASATTGTTLNLNLGGTTANSFPASGVDIDFSGLTMYSTSGSCTVKPTRGDVNNLGAGNPAGSLSGVSIKTDGKIYGVYDNNTTKCFGQISLATFANPSGLESVGSSMFSATENSGDFDGVGKDPSTVGGLTVGALEMSNVDLATEFTNMITTQRGYQANSRIITTSDTLLEELINLKR